MNTPLASRDLPGNTAVLLLAYGGPDSLDDVPDYLLDIRGGRETPQQLIDEVTERYKLIGGRSPLLAITSSAADKLERQIDTPVYVGMRHWQPYIADVVNQMEIDGVEHIIAICMAPHYSELSIGKYRQCLDQSLKGRDLTLSFIESWQTQPEYLRGLVDNINATLKRWPPPIREDVKIIFTAHSLPKYILEKGDPYDQQLRETVGLLVEKLDLPNDRWMFSYQSAAKTPVPWLGPQIEDLILELAEAGHRDVLISPIGFISDHVEVLYDLDIGVAQIAQQHGMHIERMPMLNDSAPLIDALSALVYSQLELGDRGESYQEQSRENQRRSIPI